jgi:hypothetical protein
MRQESLGGNIKKPMPVHSPLIQPIAAANRFAANALWPPSERIGSVLEQSGGIAVESNGRESSENNN